MESKPMLVKDRMSAPPVTITPDAVLRDALKLMRAHRIRRLPVLDVSGNLVGIVTERDLPHTLPSRVGSLTVWDLNYLLSQVQISEMMTEDVITTTPDTPIEDVARLMIDTKTGGLPVVDEQNHVIGVISETDIFRAFVEMFAGGRSGLRLTLAVPEDALAQARAVQPRVVVLPLPLRSPLLLCAGRQKEQNHDCQGPRRTP